jgi:hypothetical protein
MLIHAPNGKVRLHQITGYHAASPTSVAQFTIEARIIAKKLTEVIVVLITIYKRLMPQFPTIYGGFMDTAADVLQM